ncbi:hypothetical protein [Clostridium sp. MD294]|uniref:hypothetical protein n=1 Tax=Clostridium sp. MD294 TaxID=97138 RepID=UPI0002CB0945|nr:hypothetical protein [Clostridium sp. MD294]NDO46653.1 hypothetical protein [Clostridium sp. MD294]USF28914.1 hypothetical protein C820_000294 [Clostridium sp. MD294]
MSISYWKNLQPFRIPQCWTIVQHQLMNIEPEELDKNDDKWLIMFVQDILQIEKYLKRKINKKVEQQKLIIDLGWYPDGDPSGHFQLVAILNSNWEFPLLQFTSRSKKEIVETLEYWLFEIFCNIYFIENEQNFRKCYKSYQ